ncbi:hypothetical protein [Halorhodospira abdelmalekii]|uniref:hypothetical protein n=1 Tax=Halorhodospira abdelmalekii TaxID=421629 RepID=UPI00190672D8|nr:hypothetical protein [Halorhodospira abdelmalekii]
MGKHNRNSFGGAVKQSLFAAEEREDRIDKMGDPPLAIEQAIDSLPSPPELTRRLRARAVQVLIPAIVTDVPTDTTLEYFFYSGRSRSVKLSRP